MSIKKKIVNFGMKLFTGLSQDQDHHNPVKRVTPGMPELLRSVAAQGAVLLENRALPFAAGSRISVFGRVQKDGFYTGYGSGGDVNAPYHVSILEGLRQCEQLQVNEELAKVYESWIQENPVDHGVWGMWPRFYPEMPLTGELVRQAREQSDQAVIIIGRSSGEDRENVRKPGSFYLTEEEKNMLRLVTEEFPQAVLLLNIGAVMDMSFVENYSLGAVMILWQGGMESGNAAADLLCGKQVPCGHLTDTVARCYEDYPSAENFGNRAFNLYAEDIYVGYRWFETFGKDRVRYPFGYGLSYTTFSLETNWESPLVCRVKVTNTGKQFAGREAVMLFLQKPCGVLGNPVRELVAFGKTGLLEPGQSQEVVLTVNREQLASFDDAGLTGHKDCYVLQPGEYRFYVGTNVRDAVQTAVLAQPQLEVVEQLSEAAAPVRSFTHLAAREKNGIYTPVYRQAALKTTDLKRIILENLPESIPQTGDQGWKLADVKAGRVNLDAFVAQLSLEELEAISRGAYTMNHPLGAKGNTGIFAGVLPSLREKGIPVVVTTDGPSGIRLYDSCSLMPIGTLLACTFDTALVEKLMTQIGMEMKDRGSDVLLAPGMNIHRNPLCGRNFEYFSEDPLVSGKIAAAAVKGVQSVGLSACPKHFACNSQEYNRNRNDSVLSQRALREIYLKGFEICVKEAKPVNLMTSYNKINGVWGHYHFELVQTILRKEWGFAGNVMTDWWMQSGKSPEFPHMRDNAYRVRSGVDVLMPGSRRISLNRSRPDGTLLKTYGKPEGITLGEMQMAAKHVLECTMKIKELEEGSYIHAKQESAVHDHAF